MLQVIALYLRLPGGSRMASVSSCLFIVERPGMSAADTRSQVANNDDKAQIGQVVPRSGCSYRRGGARMGRPEAGSHRGMRIGNTEVRVLGGPLGCLGMILLSVLASIVLTVLLNVLL